MKKNRIKKICFVCEKEYEVIKCRELTSKVCSRKCYDKYQKNRIPWNKGKSYEELYDKEKINKIKLIQSRCSAGENNPMYGKHHNKKTRKIMSEKKKGYIPWCKGKKFPGIFSYIDRTGRNNAYIKYILKTENITYEEYLECMDDKERYYKQVRNITNLQPIHLLENYDKRNPKGYHLDHIYPISKGFDNNVPPEIIGDISNLKFIPWVENLKKADKLL